jgi:hypothetical protein
MRILLAQSLLSMKRVRENILPEFEERVQRLQKEHPLAETAQRRMAQKLMDEACGT